MPTDTKQDEIAGGDDPYIGEEEQAYQPGFAYPPYPHNPFVHKEFLHVVPQVPQFRLSVVRLVHVPPQHPREGAQAYMQKPQLVLSVCSWAQAPVEAQQVAFGPYVVTSVQTLGLVVQFAITANLLTWLPTLPELITLKGLYAAVEATIPDSLLASRLLRTNDDAGLELYMGP